MKAQLDGKIVTMQQDGWSTIHNDPVIATSVTCAGRAFFIDAKETKTANKTADKCLEMLKESKKFAEEVFGCSVRTVVTDNAKNMERMRTELTKEDSIVLSYGCLAHWLNLLGQDLTPIALMKHVTDINKYFRNHHIPSALLKDCDTAVTSPFRGHSLEQPDDCVRIIHPQQDINGDAGAGSRR